MIKTQRAIRYYALTHSLHASLLNAFEMAFMLRLFGALAPVLKLYAVFYTSLYLCFALGMALLRTGRATIGFRLDLVAQLLTAAWTFCLFPSLGSVAVLAVYFTLRGMGEGFYWSARHCSVLDGIADAERDAFFLRLHAMQVGMQVALPLVGGALLSLPAVFGGIQRPGGALPPGYAYLYLAAGLASALALVASPSLRISPQTFRAKAILKAARAKSTRIWISYQGFTALHGLAAALCAAILNVGILKTEFRLGAFASGAALAAAVAYWLLGKSLRGRTASRMAFTLVGSLGDWASRLLYALFYSYPTLIAKAVLDAFMSPLKAIFGENIVRMKVESERSALGLSSAEGYFFQESVIFLGRMVLLGAALAATGGLTAGGDSRPPVELAKAALPFFAFAVLGDYAFIRAISRSLDRGRYGRTR